MNSKTKKLLPETLLLINQVGEFINYWGFKSIEGKIWCMTYISDQPLGPADYIEAFGISKGLVSQSVKRLIEYNVIFEVAEPGRKKQFYRANQDLISVIKGVLKKREIEMLGDVESSANSLMSLESSTLNDQEINTEKVKNIVEMTQTAKSLLEMFTSNESNLFL